MAIKSIRHKIRRALRRFRGYSFLLDDNFTLDYFRKRSADLIKEISRLQKAAEYAQKQNEEVGEHVWNWLTKAEEHLKRVRELENEIKENKRRSNWRKRNQLRLKIEKNMHDIQKLQYTGDLLGMGLQNIKRAFLSNNIVPSKSSLTVLKSIVEFLNDDSVNIFVLYGKRRVGKTTLVEDLGMQAKGGKAVVVMITVSKSPDIKDIQGQIADSLDMKLEEELLVEDRARKLWSRLKQKKKVLLILDDVLEEPNWKKIGIPYGEDHRGCKILVTTPTSDLFLIPGCRCNVLSVFSNDEACDLFSKKAGLSNSTDAAVKAVANKIAKECLGLPMLIITLGSAFRGKSLDEWNKALKELKNSKEVVAVYRCLKLSFNLLQSDDTRQCFSLCSLFLQDSGIDVEDVVRCAFGHSPFHDALTIEATRTRICAAIENLKASGYLSNYNGETEVTMPKPIHDAALLIASKEENSFLKEWPSNGNLEPYFAVSLLDAKIKNLPDQELKSSKLKVLLLGGGGGEGCMRISSTFLGGLNALEGFSFHKGLLFCNSLQHAINLRALHLKGCQLNDISSLRMLKELQILSFCGSNIIELPSEIGELINLRLLDLSDCRELRTIHPDLIQKLSKLEELYLSGFVFEGWELGETSDERSNACLSELNSLSNLAILSLKIHSAHVPEDFVFPNLCKYQIGVNEVGELSDFYPTSGTLKISASSLKAFERLFQNVQDLHLSNISGCKNLMPILNGGGLNELISLELRHCKDMECIIDTTMQQVSAVAFSKLESMVIEEMISLTEVCRGLPPDGSFHKLQKLTVKRCSNMISAALMAKNLKEVIIKDCSKLEMVFQINKQDDNHSFSNLTYLKLTVLPELKCIWSGSSQNVTVPTLKVLKVKHCSGLASIFSPSIAQNLKQLQLLRIDCYCRLEQIITKVEDVAHLSPLCFPQLKTLRGN